MAKTWIEISRSALLNNFQQLRTIVKTAKILAVLKSNAYGHGLQEVGSILAETNVDFFGVDSTKEAFELRELTDKPILVLGYTEFTNALELINKNISLTVYDLNYIKKISLLKFEGKAKLHLKIDTGMHRQGIFNDEISKFLNLFKQYSNKIVLEGISTHFADVKNPPDFDFTKKQINKFLEAKKIVLSIFPNILCHSSATAGTLLYEEAHFDLVRVGIGLYGYWPAEEVKSFLSDSVKLKPVLTWKSKIAQIKEIEKGESVSYSRTWTATERTKIAVIPIGYYDGFDRKLSNIGEVLIKGKRARVLGRVCMNMIIVNVNDIQAKSEDEVIIIGEDISAEELASNIGTISYEVLARINPKIERRIIK